MFDTLAAKETLTIPGEVKNFEQFWISGYNELYEPIHNESMNFPPTARHKIFKYVFDPVTINLSKFTLHMTGKVNRWSLISNDDMDGFLWNTGGCFIPKRPMEPYPVWNGQLEVDAEERVIRFNAKQCKPKSSDRLADLTTLMTTPSSENCSSDDCSSSGNTLWVWRGLRE